MQQRPPGPGPWCMPAQWGSSRPCPVTRRGCRGSNEVGCWRHNHLSPLCLECFQLPSWIHTTASLPASMLKRLSQANHHDSVTHSHPMYAIVFTSGRKEPLFCHSPTQLCLSVQLCCHPCCPKCYTHNGTSPAHPAHLNRPPRDPYHPHDNIPYLHPNHSKQQETMPVKQDGGASPAAKL